MAPKSRYRSKRAKGQMPRQNISISNSVNDASESNQDMDSVETVAPNSNSNSTRANCQLSDMTNHNTTTNVMAELGNKKKKTRGPTCMPKIWGQVQGVNVSFNSLGQPNDKKRASTLAHFLGTIARNGSFCPLQIKDWRLIPKSNKDDMIKEVEQISEKNKQSRAKLEILHRNGKRSYAVVREIMKDHMGRYPTRAELFEKCCSTSDGSPMNVAIQEAIDNMKELASQNDGNPSVGNAIHDPYDDFAKIMGKDKAGQLRMYGMGVKPNDIYGGRPTRDALERKSMEDNEELRTMKQKVDELTALVMESRSVGHLDAKRAQFSSPNNQSSSIQINRSARVRVKSYVKLKSLVDLGEIIALGIVKQIGGVKVNGKDLGPGICEVVIQSILKDEEVLIYPHDHMQKIGDVIGAPIAWPLSLLVLDEDEN